MDGRVITQQAFRETLRLHEEWLNSKHNDGKRASFFRCDLRKASLEGTDLRDAQFPGADLGGANLAGANLAGADLFAANLSAAILRGTTLDGALVSMANFDGTLFEPRPKSFPSVASLASARNLDKLLWANSEAGLVELRSALQEAGLRRAEREVNYAIQRGRRERQWTEPNGFGDLVDALFHLVAFEITCKYGMLPGRPLLIMGCAALLFAIPYTVVLMRKSRASESDIWHVTRKERIRLLADRPIAPGSRGRLRLLPRAAGWGLYFSILNAFRVGFREINVGTWITRMQCREFTLRAAGRVRFLAGLQSLLSVYLLALWLLTYFGRPFE